jgi:CRISPR/Cas system-associated exonuclease Cas4 (RecB family)
MPEEKVVVVVFTQRMKNYTKKVISYVEKLVQEERLPPVEVGISKCLGCGYYWVCKRT